MAQPIILFDVPSTDPKRKAWSSNTWKTRFSLNYKRLTFRTEWVEYPEIESIYTKYGAAPASYHANGTPRYTVPLIHDPNTQATISDSAKIAQYLDDTYPDTAKLFPPGTQALQNAFIDGILNPLVGMPLIMNVKPEWIGLSERSLEYVNKGVLKAFGKPASELGGEIYWKNAEEGLTKVKDWLNTNGPGKNTFIMGDDICFADFQLAGIFVWAKAVYGEDSEHWKRICAWHDGKWKEYLTHFDKYMALDNI